MKKLYTLEKNKDLLEDFIFADKFTFYVILLQWALVSTFGGWFYGMYKFGFISGGLLSLIAFISYKAYQGKAILRIINAVILLTFSIVLIQQSLGRIEMHFHIFVILSFLLAYKDYKPITVASVYIILHHLLFTYFQLNGIALFNTQIVIFNYGCSYDIALLHAFFVFWESVVLLVLIKGSLKRFLDMVNYKLEIDELNENLNRKVEEKTKQIITTADMLQEAQHIASLGSWSLDIENNILKWSDEIFSIFEIDKKKYEPSNKLILNCIHPDDKQMVIEAYQDALKSGISYDITHRIVLKNGDIKYVRERGSSRYNQQGNLIQSNGTVQDITMEQNLKEQIIKEKEHALKANQFKSEFLANMSHEIRTPLNAILGFVGLLKEECKQSRIYDYVCTIEDSGKSLLMIIEDILDLTKIENNKLSVECIDFDVQKEFKTTIDIFKARAEEKNIMVSLNMDDTIPEFLQSDPLRLKQVISNLLSNAIKFTKHGKNIFVTITYSHDMLYVNVKDEGIGIAPDRVEKIFEAFTQEDISTTREYGGTGLGLTISSSLVQLLGGTLKLKSEKGKGSEFYFSVPAKIGNAVKQEINYSKDTIINKHILLVEDNPTNQMLMKILFKKLLISYEIANDGIEAVEMFKQRKYDIVLMDENMPNMNGIEATRHIREYEQQNNIIQTPIIALTANAIKGDREKFLNAGMNEYLSKPLDRNKFISVLKNVC